MGTYEKRRRWSDQYLREIKDLVGPHLLQATPKWIDIDEASDLMVLGARSQTVAARVRKHRYLERYPHDITFRAKTWGGHKSEMEKVMDGLATCSSTALPRSAKGTLRHGASLICMRSAVP